MTLIRAQKSCSYCLPSQLPSRWAVIEGGPFAAAFAKLQATGFKLRWQSRMDDPERKKKAASKTKYTCPGCGQNAWAKPGAMLICGACYEDDVEICFMEAEV